MIAGAAVQKFGQELDDQQQLLIAAADILIEIYLAESAILRTEKNAKRFGEDSQAIQIAMSKLYLYHAVDLVEENGKESSHKRTRHINIRYFFITDCIKCREFEVEYCPTNDIWVDFLTKPLQGKKFQKFREILMNLPTSNIIERHADKEEILIKDTTVVLKKERPRGLNSEAMIQLKPKYFSRTAKSETTSTKKSVGTERLFLRQ